MRKIPKDPVERLAFMAGRYFVVAVIGLGLGVAIFWLLQMAGVVGP